MEKKNLVKSCLTLAMASCMAFATACMGGSGDGSSSVGGNSASSGSAEGEKVYIEVCDLVKDKSGVDGVFYNRQQKFAQEYPNIVVTHSESVVDDSTKTV